MNKLERPKIDVSVLSSQRGCLLLSEIMKRDGYNFTFVSSQKELEQKSAHFLIADDTYKIDRLIDSLECHTIVLKDSQKGVASILALSGQLSTFGQNSKDQFVPSHILDFAVGIGLAIYLLQVRNSTKAISKSKVQISLIDLVQYYGAFNFSAKENGFLKNPLGQNLLDGGAPFYSLYICKEGILAVGNLEPKFYQEMVKGLKVDEKSTKFLIENQFNDQKWGQIRQILKDVFIEKPASQWQKIMSFYDTCVTEVSQRPRNQFSIQPKIYPLVKPKI